LISPQAESILMQRKIHVVAFALLLSFALATPAEAQQSTPQSNINIAYETPTNPKLTSIYTRLKQRRVLEELQAFMVPLRLPRDLTVRLAQCDSENIPYKPQTPATICYELIDKIEQVAANHTTDPDLQQTVVIGGLRSGGVARDRARAVRCSRCAYLGTRRRRRRPACRRRHDAVRR
jgi:Putative metallopeptidase